MAFSSVTVTWPRLSCEPRSVRREEPQAVLVDGDQVTSWGGFGSKLVIAPGAPHGLTSAC